MSQQLGTWANKLERDQAGADGAAPSKIPSRQLFPRIQSAQLDRHLAKRPLANFENNLTGTLRGPLTTLHENKAPDKPVRSETTAATKVSKVPSLSAVVPISHLAGIAPVQAKQE